MLFAFLSNNQLVVFHVSLGIKSNVMVNYKKQLEQMNLLAAKLKAQKRTKEEILADFVGAGILDTQGNFTEPYKILQQFKIKDLS
jgi:hypothetical protein